jgi:hypothetical protein
VFAYLYRAAIAVTESNGTAYSMLPIMVPSNNDWLADNGFMQADALDTRVETLGGLAKPHMVTDNMTIFASLIPASSQTNLYFSTGNSDLVTMDIVMGYGGYVTVADHADLEFANNFSVNLTDVNSGIGRIIGKGEAWGLYRSSSSNVTGAILSLTSQTGVSSSTEMYSGYRTRAGQHFTSYPISYIYSVEAYIAKSGSPTGTANLTIRKASDDSVIGIIGSVNVSTLGAAAWIKFDTTPVLNPVAQDIYVCVEYNGGDAGNKIIVSDNTPSSISGVFAYYDGSWHDGATYDTSIKIVSSSLFVSSSITLGTNDYILNANTTNLTLIVNGAVSDTIALGAVSVPNNANNIIIGSSAVSYIESVSITTGGTLRATYAPTSMIIGTNLPNNSTPGSYNGTFTWGANPAGIAVTLGGLVSSGQPDVGSTSSPSPNDRLPESGGGDWFGEPAVAGSLLTNPLRPFVTLVSDNTTLTELQTWRWMGLIVVLLVTAIAVKTVPRHLIIACIAAGVATVAMVVLSIWPLWALAMLVLYVVGGVISERSPSL